MGKQLGLGLGLVLGQGIHYFIFLVLQNVVDIIVLIW